MKTIYAVMLGSLVGAVITVSLYLALPISSSDMSTQGDIEPEPLYWVAPMDPNFRRDQPGLSAMGMDLVPVYPSDNATDNPGAIYISADVVNNLGVRTAKARVNKLDIPIATVGYVHFNQNKLVHIHPRVEGWVDKLYLKAAGETVNKGEPLYTLYSPELVNAQEEYILAKSSKNKTLIRAAESRMKALQMPTADLEVLKQSGKVMQTLTFTAPQSGVIDNLNIREGVFVKPGTALMSIGALDDVWVEANVFERQAGQVKAGQMVTMSIGFIPGEFWQGQVDYVYPTLDPETRTERVRLVFDNPNRQLKPHMFADIIINTNSDKALLLVPSEAVIRTGTQDRVVLALGDGQFKSVEVTMGRLTRDFVEITQGLEAGDEVVTSAQFLLDSQSSISSDFKRMYHSTVSQMSSMQEPQSAKVQGVINSFNYEAQIANISRGAIEKWGRGPAILDFMFADDVDVSMLNVGSNVVFTFEKREENFVVVSIELLDKTSMKQTATKQRETNHD